MAALVGAAVSVFRNPPDGLRGARDAVVDEGSFVLYWVTLGVLSSVGLGSGLHTFVLFLGPHIVRIANAAILHGNTGPFVATGFNVGWSGSSPRLISDCF